METLDWRQVRWVDVPAALARLHADLAVDARVALRFPPGDGATPELKWLLEGAGFEPAGGTAVGTGLTGSRRPITVSLRRRRTLPDVVGPGMRALICGLNPSLVSSDVGFAYAGATNRFWNAALSSGLVRVARQPLEALRVDGVGMTDVVKRPTPRSHHLDPHEYQVGLQRLERLAAWLVPGVVIFVGLEGWRGARDRRARAGWQTGTVGGCPAYVMPSTSGANARTPPSELVAHLQAALGPPGP
jgi:double-stranded uracil-DNA glycosylase